MAVELSHVSMETLLTDFSEQLRNLSLMDVPQKEIFEILASDLEIVTQEFKSRSVCWKNTTEHAQRREQQAEESTRRLDNEWNDIAEGRRLLNEEGKKLKEDERLFTEEKKRIEVEKSLLAEDRKKMIEKEEQSDIQRAVVDEVRRSLNEEKEDIYRIREEAIAARSRAKGATEGATRELNATRTEVAESFSGELRQFEEVRPGIDEAMRILRRTVRQLTEAGARGLEDGFSPSSPEGRPAKRPRRTPGGSQMPLEPTILPETSTAGPENEQYDEDGQAKRWKLSVRKD